jgi:fructose-1,6-bisphosphatase/inositol monophosphatase family enzyme
MAEFSFDMDAALSAAVDAALQAGQIMRDCYALRYTLQAEAARGKQGGNEGPSSSGVAAAAFDMSIDEKSAPTDLVTKFDKLCDEAIMARLQRLNAEITTASSRTQPFQFITEELCPDAPLTDAPTWIVDPIDGTMAFVHQSFDCCVSIGLAVGKKPVLGVVYCPFLGGVLSTATASTRATTSACFPSQGELYTAVAGRGAFLNGTQIFVNKAPMQKSVVIFNMPWRMAAPAIDAAVAIRRALALSKFHAIRSYGAAVLQLAQVAAGRAGLYMEPGGKAWDVCAGAVLVHEAGGFVTALDGNPFTLEEHTITAAATEELAVYGAGLCRQHDFRRAYFAD